MLLAAEKLGPTLAAVREAAVTERAHSEQGFRPA